MIVSINQPAYLPWLGYFHRIAVSDVHIVLDHVQFEKNSFTNRNRILTAHGPRWLSVPLLTKGRYGRLPIHDLEIVDSGSWRDKHWKTIAQSYGKAPYFDAYAPFLESVYVRAWARLSELCETVTEYLLRSLGIRTPLRRSSEMRADGVKDELVLALCREAGADTYLSGALGREYLRQELFENAGMALAYQDYVHPRYAQALPGFEPYLSVIDLLFNCGPRSLEVITERQALKARI